jgi:hypothetical protein
LSDWLAASGCSTFSASQYWFSMDALPAQADIASTITTTTTTTTTNYHHHHHHHTESDKSGRNVSIETTCWARVCQTACSPAPTRSAGGRCQAACAQPFLSCQPARRVWLRLRWLCGPAPSQTLGTCSWSHQATARTARQSGRRKNMLGSPTTTKQTPHTKIMPASQPRTTIH